MRGRSARGSRAAAIVPSAGFGKRLGKKTKKPFVLLGGRPLASYALKALDASPHIGAIYIAVEPECVARFRRLVRTHRIKKVAAITAGGATRAESVRNCLRLVDPSYDIVLIHDAARPFLDGRLIAACVRSARMHGGCIAAIPVNDTVKLAGKGGVIRATLDRSRLWRAQTPQAFRRTALEAAYRRAGGRAAEATDDARLVELSGKKVRIVPGSYRNIKITTEDDLQLAETMV